MPKVGHSTGGMSMAKPTTKIAPTNPLRSGLQLAGQAKEIRLFRSSSGGLTMAEKNEWAGGPELVLFQLWGLKRGVGAVCAAHSKPPHICQEGKYKPRPSIKKPPTWAALDDRSIRILYLASFRRSTPTAPKPVPNRSRMPGSGT